MYLAHVAVKVGLVQETVLTVLTGQHAHTVHLQVDVQVRLSQELVLAELALEHGVLSLLVKVVLWLGQGGWSRSAPFHSIVVVFIAVVVVVIVVVFLH